MTKEQIEKVWGAISDLTWLWGDIKAGVTSAQPGDVQDWADRLDAAIVALKSSLPHAIAPCSAPDNTAQSGEIGRNTDVTKQAQNRAEKEDL